MGMLLNSFGVAAGGPAPGTLLVGSSTGTATNAGTISPDFQMGSAFQAVASGTANTFNIRASTVNATTANFYLSVYGATSATVWSGALLAKTALITAGLSVNQVLSVPLLTPLSIVSGTFYALSVLGDANVLLNCPGGVDERASSDAFSDGPAATVGATFLNSGNGICAWLTT